ncbi:allergin-1 isoform X1 [Pyxicephalus adspersus]|uniref:allergin-1 isoform X1 n=1 Tax=Pyxicephalus adspersus TaxID=30357 RepID=UPI003B5A27EB
MTFIGLRMTSFDETFSAVSLFAVVRFYLEIISEEFQVKCFTSCADQTLPLSLCLGLCRSAMETLWLATFCLLNIAVPITSGATNASRQKSELKLIPGSSYTTIGKTETVQCLSRNGSSPITYTLFHNKKAKGTVTVSGWDGATFNVTIHNETNLGVYQCKANNSVSTDKYSQKFNFTLQEKLSNPELTPGSPNVTIGHTMTIRCLIRNASLPITFILFHNKTTKGKKTVTEEGEATFNVTIYNLTNLGPYQCKANKSTSNAYSKTFTFTLQDNSTPGSEPTGGTNRGWTLLVWLIPLLVLVLLIAAFVYWRISTPAAKQEAIHDTNTYENVSAMKTGSWREEEVQYCTVIIKEGSRDTRHAEQTTEYMDLAKTGGSAAIVANEELGRQYEPINGQETVPI